MSTESTKPPTLGYLHFSRELLHAQGNVPLLLEIQASRLAVGSMSGLRHSTSCPMQSQLVGSGTGDPRKRRGLGREAGIQRLDSQLSLPASGDVQGYKDIASNVELSSASLYRTLSCWLVIHGSQLARIQHSLIFSRCCLWNEWTNEHLFIYTIALQTPRLSCSPLYPQHPVQCLGCSRKTVMIY